MASRMYCVKVGRMELLFWKNDPPLNSKNVLSTRSRTEALLFVMQILVFIASASSSGVRDEDKGRGTSVFKDSRNSRVEPFLNVERVLTKRLA